jgi:hypothetical protein
MAGDSHGHLLGHQGALRNIENPGDSRHPYTSLFKE